MQPDLRTYSIADLNNLSVAEVQWLAENGEGWGWVSTREQRMWFVANPVAYESLLKNRLASDVVYYLAQQDLSNHTDVILTLLRNWGRVDAQLAKNPSVPVDVLKILVRERFWSTDVLAGLAYNPSSDDSILSDIVPEAYNQSTLVGVITHPNASRGTIVSAHLASLDLLRRCIVRDLQND